MNHEAAIAKLDQHAKQCEENAAIQRGEGNWKEADFNDGLAASYRIAIEVLKTN